MVYTSPESLNYICQCDRDANVNFDQEEPVAKWGRGRDRGQLEEITRAGVGVGEMEGGIEQGGQGGREAGEGGEG